MDIQKRFQMMDCKPLATPMVPNLKLHACLDSNYVYLSIYRQLFGYPMYLVNTGPNICFPKNTLSQSMVEPWQIHQIVAKYVSYLKGTVHYGLRHVGDGELVLHGFVDSD